MKRSVHPNTVRLLGTPLVSHDYEDLDRRKEGKTSIPERSRLSIPVSPRYAGQVTVLYGVRQAIRRGSKLPSEWWAGILWLVSSIIYFVGANRFPGSVEWHHLPFRNQTEEGSRRNTWYGWLRYLLIISFFADSIQRSDMPVNTLQSTLRDFISHSIFLAIICISESRLVPVDLWSFPVIYPVHWSAARRLTNVAGSVSHFLKKGILQAVNNLFTRTVAPSGKRFAEIDRIDDIWEVYNLKKSIAATITILQYMNYQLVEGLYWEPRMNNISGSQFQPTLLHFFQISPSANINQTRPYLMRVGY